MLYRLDFIDAEGNKQRAVTDIAGDVLCRHMTTARRIAIERSAAEDCSVLITRIGKAGAMKPSLVVEPGGRCTRPPGMDGEDCKRGTGVACFCRNCRAERRASR